MKKLSYPLISLIDYHWFVNVTLQDDISLEKWVASFEGRFPREGRVNHKWDNLNILSVSLPDALAEKVRNLLALCWFWPKSCDGCVDVLLFAPPAFQKLNE